MKAYLCAIKKKLCDTFIAGDDFIKNSSLQLPYHDELLNSTKGHMS